MILQALRINHAALPNGFKAWVKDSLDLVAFDDDGVEVLFEAGDFQFQRPEKNLTGQRSLKVAAVNADLTLIKAFESVKYHMPPAPITAELFEFDTDDLSAPSRKTLRLTVSNYNVGISTIAFQATWKDLVNRRFMRRINTPKTHPGLALI